MVIRFPSPNSRLCLCLHTKDPTIQSNLQTCRDCLKFEEKCQKSPLGIIKKTQIFWPNRFVTRKRCKLEEVERKRRTARIHSHTERCGRSKRCPRQCSSRLRTLWRAKEAFPLEQKMVRGCLISNWDLGLRRCRTS